MSEASATALHPASDDALARADDALLVLDAQAALAALQAAGARRASALGRMLDDAAQALRCVDDPAQALQHAERAVAAGLPLPGVLRAAAIALARAGAYERAHACLARLLLLGHDHLKAFLEALPPAQTLRFLPLVRHVYDARPVANLHLLQAVKHVLPQALGPADADSVYTRLFDLPAHGAHALPLEHALDYVRRERRPLHTVIAAQAFHLWEPRRVGEPRVEMPQLAGRTMFYSPLEDVRAIGRSSLLWLADRALIDAQGSELDDVQPSLNIDPLVMRHSGPLTVDVLPAPRARTRRMARAIHLLGWSTHFFGHWMTEYLPKIVALMADERLAGVPILVDEGMPAQHFEALEMLVGDRHPVVTVPMWGSVQVRRLWWCSTAMYVPVLPRNGQNLDATHMSAPPAAFAALIDTMRTRFAAQLGEIRRGRRLYVARGPGRRRRMENMAEVEALAADHGFDIVHPEKLSFAEQVRLAQEATHIVGPEGSGLMLSYFAAPGTRLCLLNHEFLENLPTMCSTFEALGVETSIIYGRCTRRDENPRFSDYVIDPQSVHHLFATWGLAPGRPPATLQTD